MNILLTHSKARSFAETAWGRGGTTSRKTNRKGVYYFSCSGHGGYIVDGNTLSETEKEQIKKYVKPYVCLTVTDNEKLTFIENPVSVRKQRYYTKLSSKVFSHEIYFFEEDCDWSVLEKFTDIEYKNENLSNNNREKTVDDCFNRWHLNKEVA